VTELSPIDHDAMARAIEIMRHRDQASAIQIADKLASEPWEEVGRFAAYGAQGDTLRLRPWQWPPCWIADIEAELAAPPDQSGRQRAAELLQRMLAAGLSRFEPDPLAALEQAEGARQNERVEGSDTGMRTHP
jgi:hypothetical protein